MTIELKTQRDVEVWNAAIDAVGEHVTGSWVKSFKRPDIVGKNNYSNELDKVIEDEMKHKPKDIMK
jgi:hypothetical protein